MAMEGLRWEVASRDDFRCIASRVDPDSGPCYSRWGTVLPGGRVPIDEGEIDYVRFGATTPHHKDARDHVWTCPGHHRGTGPNAGLQWCTSHRRSERLYLDTVYADR